MVKVSMGHHIDLGKVSTGSPWFPSGAVPDVAWPAARQTRTP